MGSLPDTERLSLFNKQSRAKSAPLDSQEQQAPKKMGRGYRTPSPSRAMDYVFESPVSPLQMSRPKTPTIASPGTISAPSTPNMRLSFSNMFGLLTPGTPNFGNFNTAKATQGSCKVDDRDVINVHQYSTGSDTTVGGAIDMTKDNTAGLHIERQSPRTAQKQPARRGVIEIDSEDDSETDEPLQTQYDRMQREIRDAQLAADLAKDSSVTGARRSTRLATKEAVKEPLVTVAPLKSAKKPDAIKISETTVLPPKSSLASDAIVQLPPDPDPTVLTLSWELQYPPGGSTHPSYRYPELDPRLIFNPSIMPIVNGLPNIHAVPPLVLPMGWRHVTWSSLLPIVFDPNHQAFKLTPIGPLPLTCEEVQQGGLARYVPGGDCHPEAGLLPDVTKCSDGSEEVYNFDDTDWVLPFEESERFDAPTIIDQGHANGSARRGSSTSTTVARAVSNNAAPPVHIESRDCPDGIVDIEEAWRWIEHLEKTPNTAFVPSPTKTWHGTGIKKSGRKGKLPIASLMGHVFQDMLEDPNDRLASYLLPQDGRDFCPFKSVATPVHVNIALLGDVEVTLVELLTYFPMHFMWRKAADRIVRAGMTASDVDNMINYTRVLEGVEAPSRNNINEHMFYTSEIASDATGTKKRVKIVRDKTDEVLSYTTEGWTYTNWEMIDYPLLGLAHGLKHLPQGPDAGPLTAMIQWVREQERYDTLLSDVPAIIDRAGIKSLIEPGENGDPDKEVMNRLAEVLKQDRRRVLTIAGKRKTVEKEAGGRKKRVKAE
ncbi:hypothetical protein FB567DRAFT_80615 [Paraphoma chrysanthemicola]|uniref:Uncharacterized protein n=1 Tax=Paraphoma chrysanthemicola TaxID=798071 RepID=A0A8K0R5N6_9PLEO|nr:hypothetical protein FB567DRAFT_80615 [Paraphoma chrysanthemicola]